MPETFNAEHFLRRLRAGEFDGRVLKELQELSAEQLQAVALSLMDKPEQKQEARAG